MNKGGPVTAETKKKIGHFSVFKKTQELTDNDYRKYSDQKTWILVFTR